MTLNKVQRPAMVAGASHMGNVGSAPSDCNRLISATRLHGATMLTIVAAIAAYETADLAVGMAVATLNAELGVP